MDTVLEDKRQASMAGKQAWNTQQDTKRLERLESNLEKVTYSDPHKEQKEHAERMANQEARWKQEMSNDMNEIEMMKYDVSYRRLADFIGLDPNDIESFGNELNTIMGWAKDTTKDKNILGILDQVKTLKRDLGFQEIGGTAVKKLYQYIRLDLDSRRIQKEKALLKK